MIKKLCILTLICLLFTACNEPEDNVLEAFEVSDTMEISNTYEWRTFTHFYNSGAFAEFKSVKVNVTSPLELSGVQALGNGEFPFSGTIDFGGNHLKLDGALVKNAKDLKIANVLICQNESKSAQASLVGSAGSVEFENIRINPHDSREYYGSIFYSSSALVMSAGTVKMKNVEVFDAVFSGNYTLGGWVGDCTTLYIDNLKMSCVTVSVAVGDGVVESASLIANTVEQATMKNCTITNCLVSATDYASGAFIFCESLKAFNTKYNNVTVSTFDSASVPPAASGLVSQGLEVFEYNELEFTKLNLVSHNTGYITAEEGDF